MVFDLLHRPADIFSVNETGDVGFGESREGKALVMRDVSEQLSARNVDSRRMPPSDRAGRVFAKVVLLL
jgi:hypothetical protein